MSSSKKVGVEHLSIQRDQQFQIQNLADDSSENSSRRGQYEVAHFQDSEQQHQTPTSTKSLDQIQCIQDNKNTNRSQDSKQINQNHIQQTKGKVQHVAIQQNYKSDEDKQTQNQTKNQSSNLEGTLEQKKKRRKKIFQKIKQSSSQKPKVKTKSSKINLQDEQTLQTNKQQQILNRVAFQKKRQNHTMLKAWNYRRLTRLQFHKNISEQLIKNIDKNSKSSLEIFQVFHAFFVQRCRQEQIQLNFNYLQNEQALQQNDVSRNIHIANSLTFKNLLKRQKKQKQIVSNFINFIQTKITKQIFQQYLDNTHKQFVNLRERVKLMNETMNKLQETVCTKLIRLQKYFSQSCQNVTEETSVDFYRAELSFLSKCQAEMAMENRFGQIIIQYYQAAIKQQLKRKQLLQKSLMMYKSSYESFQKSISESRKVQLQKIKSLKSLQIKNTQCINEDKQSSQIYELYKLQNLLQPETVNQIQQKIGDQLQIRNGESGQQTALQTSQKQSKIEKQTTEHTQQVKRLHIQQFKMFYLHYQFQQFDCHHLIMKKFDVQVLKQGKWIPGQIVITIDKFVHIFVSARRQMGVLLFGSQIYYKPEFTLKTHYIKLGLTKQTKSDQYDISSDQELQIKIGTKKQLSALQKVASLIKTNKRMQQTVRFSKQNDLIQFQDYVQQLSV